jgi:hypothetical protein
MLPSAVAGASRWTSVAVWAVTASFAVDPHRRSELARTLFVSTLGMVLTIQRVESIGTSAAFSRSGGNIGGRGIGDTRRPQTAASESRAARSSPTAGSVTGLPSTAMGPERAADTPLRGGLLGPDIECVLEACEGLVDVARDDLDPPGGSSLLENSDERVVHLADRVGML